MNAEDRNELFSELITTYQSRLYGYIFALVRNWDDTADLFQSVCVILWQKFDSFTPADQAFFPWARQTAIYEVRNYLRRQKGRRALTEKLLEMFTDGERFRHSDETMSYLDALQLCKEKLPATDRELLDCHYGEGLSPQQIADQLGRSRQSLYNSLQRIRRGLLDCIRRELAKQDHPEELSS